MENEPVLGQTQTSARSRARSACPPQRTSSVWRVTSEKCRFCCKSRLRHAAKR